MLNVLLSDLAASILMKSSIIDSWTYLYDMTRLTNLSISEILSVIHSIHVPDKIPKWNCLLTRVVYPNKWSFETNLQEQKALCKQTFYFA